MDSTIDCNCTITTSSTCTGIHITGTIVDMHTKNCTYVMSVAAGSPVPGYAIPVLSPYNCALPSPTIVPGMFYSPGRSIHGYPKMQHFRFFLLVFL